MDAPRFDIIGHRRVAAKLARLFEEERIPASLALFGPPRIGKATLARQFAEAILCGRGRCLACPQCQALAAGSHPDLAILEPEEGVIAIDRIRELRGDLALSPSLASHRVGLIVDCDTATTEAQNALLKTLEEPAATSLLILTSSHPGRLLPTVRSRCQILFCSPPSEREVEEGLRARGIEQASALARIAGGEVGLALSQGVALIERFAKLRQDFDALRAKSIGERLLFAAKHDPRELIPVWLRFLRDDLRREPKGEHVRLASLLLEAEELLELPINRRLLLETLLLEFPIAKSGQPA